jgi:sensor histidine kinase YesM
MSPERTRLCLHVLGRFAMMAFGVAVAVPLLEWSFEPHAAFSYLLTEYVIALAYAFSIGALLTVALALLWRPSSVWSAPLRWVSSALAVVAATALGCLVAGLVPVAIFGATYNYWASFAAALKIGLVLSTIAATFAVAYERVRSRLQVSALELKSKELERQRALKLATQARLESLESRVHPHFLFNTINSVSSLIPEDPERAERMLTRMANLLRFSLDSAQAGLVSLERESRIVEDYLEIERARFQDRLRYEIAIPAELHSACVPPLTLQTLAENSVKYAVGGRRQGATIRISAEAHERVLIVAVCDDGPGFDAAALPAGHGLNNLEERLTALFGGNAELEIRSTSEGTSVRIEMPLIMLESANNASLHSYAHQ